MLMNPLKICSESLLKKERGNEELIKELKINLMRYSSPLACWFKVMP